MTNRIKIQSYNVNYHFLSVDKFYFSCWCLFGTDEDLGIYDPHLECKIYGRYKIQQFANEQVKWTETSAMTTIR